MVANVLVDNQWQLINSVAFEEEFGNSRFKLRFVENRHSLGVIAIFASLYQVAEFEDGQILYGSFSRARPEASVCADQGLTAKSEASSCTAIAPSF